MTEKALAEEIAFYEEHFEEYRRKYAGRYLLIHGAELIGVYDDELEADYAGYRQVWRTGTEGRGYLVKKAGEPAMPIVELLPRVAAGRRPATILTPPSAAAGQKTRAPSGT